MQISNNLMFLKIDHILVITNNIEILKINSIIDGI